MGGENPLEMAGRGETPRNMRKKRIKKAKVSALTRISFLPSVFTMLNLFLGYQALIHVVGAKRNFKLAIYYITASVIMDGFDGTIARLTKTESNFGMQLDSLVDAVTFGLVTAMLAYKWGFQIGYAQAGSIVSFVFLSAGLIRLARFNVFKEAQVMPANTFIGLPIPVGALAVCSVVLIFDDRPPLNPVGLLLFSFYVLLVSLLMISNIKYRTVKNLAHRESLKTLFLLALVVSSLIIFPDSTIPLLTFSYMISPLLFFLFSRRSPGAEKKAEPASEEQSEA
ncbi:MAG: CDP-diacylglycerol--serine O-phosphatidyltransferase [Acidobacteria bacterium]|jgi:CDP-diacylglycerol--serine O-phosphatidyltransferase|nr:CDP-diacylglycerol--serine O-phosphatidyltransferase [Acidobacteriota bacterium]